MSLPDEIVQVYTKYDCPPFTIRVPHLGECDSIDDAFKQVTDTQHLPISYCNYKASKEVIGLEGVKYVHFRRVE